VVAGGVIMKQPTYLTPRALERLARFLSAPQRAEGTLSVYEAQGFLFTSRTVTRGSRSRGRRP
jgi:hypothetical protein